MSQLHREKILLCKKEKYKCLDKNDLLMFALEKNVGHSKVNYLTKMIT